jgi:RNA polymerase sporulation-specific sigma factor
MFYLISIICANLIFFALHFDGNSFPKPLNAKQEKEAFDRLKAGDSSARNLLIEHNLRLVAHVIKKYYSSTNDQDDLISIGTIGLIKAVSSFDYDKGTRFATYASKCIGNEILMHFRNVKKSAGCIYFGDTVDTDKDGNTLNLIDLIADDFDIASAVDLKLNSTDLYNHIKTKLNYREQQIIVLRYGLMGRVPLAQREVAKKLNISRSYV